MGFRVGCVNIQVDIASNIDFSFPRLLDWKMKVNERWPKWGPIASGMESVLKVQACVLTKTTLYIYFK